MIEVTKKFHGGTLSRNLIFPDNIKAIFGTASGLGEIYSDGADLNVNTGTGQLNLTGDLDISGHLAVGENVSISSTTLVNVSETSTDAALATGLLFNISQEGDAGAVNISGINGTINAQNITGDATGTWKCGFYSLIWSGGSNTLTKAIGVDVVAKAFFSTIDTIHTLEVEVNNTVGNLTDGVAIFVKSFGNFNGISSTNIAGIWIDPQTADTNARGLVLNGDGAGSDTVYGAGKDGSIQEAAAGGYLELIADLQSVGGRWVQTTGDHRVTGELRGVGGVLVLNETTTPTPVANHGSIYTKANNELFFQDGSGVEHLLHGDAFSNIWFHSVSKDTITISAADTFNIIDSFENVGVEDDLNNAVGNVTNNNIVIGANGGGKYDINFHVSITSNGAASEMVVAVGITLNTPLNITAATNATPIVITIVGHGLFNGDMITIVGATGNTAANGDWVVTAKTADNITLVDLSANNSVGNGVYDSGSGDITIDYPGNLPMHRQVSQTDLGVGGSSSESELVTGDEVALYVANIGATRDLELVIVNLEIFRIGD